MIKEDKELLLKDLCARLPFGIKCHEDDVEYSFDIIGTTTNNKEFVFSDGYERSLEQFKPYLRPMSSMTEEEIKEVSEIDMKRVIFSSRHLTWHLDGEVIDYFNKKMLDWRGLIPAGLALEAPEDMYK